LVLCVSSIAGVPLLNDPQSLRLVELSHNNRVLLSEQQLLALKKAEIGFIDVTEVYHEIDQSDLHILQEGAAPKKNIPTTPTQQETVIPLLEKLDMNQWEATVVGLSSYPNRLYNNQNGVASAQWLFSRYQSFANGNNVSFFNHSFVQPSIIAKIPGSSLANEIVVIGGHIDSISFSGSAPGADDDASVSGTVLEAFRVLTASDFRPRRTLEFHGYAGEEGGLLGSADIAASYRSAGADVFAMVQFDMTCFPGRSGNRNIGMTNDYTDSSLTSFLKALVDEYTNAHYAESTCGYGCSDHASWNRFAYQSAFPFEAPFGDHNPDIHTPNDLLDNCDYEHQAEFLKLALSAAIELSA